MALKTWSETGNAHATMHATAMSVKVLKIPHSLTEIVKKLKEWKQKEAAWVFSFLLPLRTYKYKCGKAEDDALKCLDHLEKFSKGTADASFKHSQAITLCTEAYKWLGREKNYWVCPSMHMPFTLCPSFDTCNCCPLSKISYIFTHLQERQAYAAAAAAAAATTTMPQPQPQASQPALVTTTPHPQQQFFLQQQVPQLAIFATAPQPAAATSTPQPQQKHNEANSSVDEERASKRPRPQAAILTKCIYGYVEFLPAMPRNSCPYGPVALVCSFSGFR